MDKFELYIIISQKLLIICTVVPFTPPKYIEFNVVSAALSPVTAPPVNVRGNPFT